MTALEYNRKRQAAQNVNVQTVENSAMQPAQKRVFLLHVSLPDSTDIRVISAFALENTPISHAGGCRNRKTVMQSKSSKRGTPTFNVKQVKYPPKKHVVYFVEATNGLIKIGTTANIEWRFASLRTQSPLPLKLLATVPGKRADEFAYHECFAEHRLHGEWFKPHPDILAEIQRLTTPSPTSEIARLNPQEQEA